MLTNIIIGILLGFILFKSGELIFGIISKSKFIEAARFNRILLNKKKIEQKEIEPLM